MVMGGSFKKKQIYGLLYEMFYLVVRFVKYHIFKAWFSEIYPCLSVQNWIKINASPLHRPLHLEVDRSKSSEERSKTMSGEGKFVCVTGASGFIASWLVKLLLLRRYTVHATLRRLGLSPPTFFSTLASNPLHDRYLHQFNLWFWDRLLQTIRKRQSTYFHSKAQARGSVSSNPTYQTTIPSIPPLMAAAEFSTPLLPVSCTATIHRFISTSYQLLTFVIRSQIDLH